MGDPNSPDMKNTTAVFIWDWAEGQRVACDVYLVLGDFLLGSDWPTIPSAVPDNPAVLSSVSTTAQQNLQPAVTSTCKFGINHRNLSNQDRNATRNVIILPPCTQRKTEQFLPVSRASVLQP